MDLIEESDNNSELNDVEENDNYEEDTSLLPSLSE